MDYLVVALISFAIGVLIGARLMYNFIVFQKEPTYRSDGSSTWDKYERRSDADDE